MTATRWRLLEDLFFRALELPEEDRDRFLERECEDAALREEVRATLTAASDERALTVEGSVLRSERLAEIADHPIAVSGQDVGPWRLVHLLGRGGMGEVWLAERRNAGFEQWGALKLMRAGWRAAALVERFERERQLLARLTHPNIAGLLDGGITADGVPFLVMQYVDGTPIDRWCEESSLSNRERLRLFRTLCDVVQYAHTNLVVHRDLKPSNILVTSDGRPMLLDFGIAKLLASDAEGAAVTGEGEALFTPERAAPEQRLGRPLTTATDVWALGVLLRELAGEKGELQAIVAQALHEEPERRYRSAGELGDDVDRALAGLPVRAKPDTLRYRTARFLRRNRGATVSAALIATLLVTFGISSWRSGRALEHERDAAVAARDESDRVSGFLVGLLESTNPRVNPGADSLGVRGLIRLGEERVDDLTDLPGVRVKLWRTFAELRRTRSELTEERALLERALSDAQAAGREDEVLELESARARNSFNLDGAAVARPLLEDALHRTEVRYGPESPETLAALLDLQPALADLDARRDLLDRATRIATICSPSPSLGLARVWNERGNTEWHAGNLPAAADAYGRALSELDSVLGPDHPHTLVVRNNLAATQLRAGDFPAAERTLRAVLESRRRVLGDDTIDVATTLQNLGSLYAQTGDERQAVERLREALRILDVVYGPDHVETIAARSDLGRALVLSGEAETGLATMDAMYARAVKRGDSEPWWLAGLRLRRLEAEANAGRTIRIDAAQVIREQLGKVSRDRESLARADVLLASAILADRGGDASAAVAALEEALSIQESAGLAAHPMHAHARCALAVARARNGVAPDLATLEADLVRAEAWGLSFAAVLGDANALAGRPGRDR